MKTTVLERYLLYESLQHLGWTSAATCLGWTHHVLVQQSCRRGNRRLWLTGLEKEQPLFLCHMPEPPVWPIILPLKNNHATALIKRAHGQSQSLLPEANPLEDLLQLLCVCSLSTLPSSETMWTQKARPLFAVWEALLSNIIAVLKEWGFKLGENIWSGFMLSLRHQGLFSGMLVTHSSSWSQRDWRVNTLVLIRDVVSQTQRALKACHENLGLGSKSHQCPRPATGAEGFQKHFVGLIQKTTKKPQAFKICSLPH